MFPENFYQFLKENNLAEIRAGSQRRTFTSIWMVVVNKRVFARSWNKSTKSWFTEFVRTGMGQIKYGPHFMDVIGVKTDRNDLIQTEINDAYLEKYTQEENRIYAEGITRPEYADHTMEFKMIIN